MRDSSWRFSFNLNGNWDRIFAIFIDFFPFGFFLYFFFFILFCLAHTILRVSLWLSILLVFALAILNIFVVVTQVIHIYFQIFWIFT